MTRKVVIPGETLVKVRGTGSLLDAIGESSLRELGLASEEIRITPRFYHRDINVDDFGSVPVEVLWQLGECRIDMTLIHYDQDILQACLAESMAGAPGGVFDNNTEGVVMGAGSPMRPAFNDVLPYLDNPNIWVSSGWHYISLNLTSPVLQFPWRFPTAYLTSQPLEIPLGVQKSIVSLSWRALPIIPFKYFKTSNSSFPASGMEYQTPNYVKGLPRYSTGTLSGGPGPLTSSGNVLWIHALDSI